MTTQTPVRQLQAGPRQVAATVLVAAPAAEIFALVADPRRHPELDGSGTLRPLPVKGPEQLSPGAKFTVQMRQYGFPYAITSTVTALERDALVEWRHPMGHRWRWQLEPAQGGTQVTETFDYDGAKAPWMLELLGQPAKNRAGITATLQALAARFGG